MNGFNKALGRAMMLGSALCMSAGATAADGVKIDHVGLKNTLVRVDGDAKYILLPIQDNNEDSKVNVIVDGKLEKTFYAKLARTKTDFTVPLDISQWKGKKIVLDILSPQARSSVRETQSDVAWRGIKLSNTYDSTNQEKYRPLYHHTPQWGWMNDPNGMYYADGKWHLNYQLNPWGSKWENLSWGHSVSDDLIHWEHMPNTLEPDGHGYIFSGSAIIDKDNTAGFGKDAVIGMYTSAACHHSDTQMQSIAASLDGGKTFKTFNANPVITLDTEARDPKVFWNDKTGEWNVILAHALEHEMLIYSSPDLKNWTYRSNFGKGLGAQDGVWECPDMFELPVQGTKDKKWVLICNINPGGPFGGSGTQYFIGNFDGKEFKADKDKNGNVPTKWMDYGKDHYATVTWHNAPDNRRTAIGWMSNWQYAAEVPTKQYRSANTVTRELSLFKGADGEIYLASTPSPELLKMRGEIVEEASNKSLNPTPFNYSLPSSNDGACEILVDFEAKKAAKCQLELSNKNGEKVLIVYNGADRTLSFDRTQAGISDFSQDFPAVTVTPTHEKDGKISLRIFVDRSSMEVFGNGGNFVMTNLVFPTTPYTTLSMSAPEGYVKVNNIKVYSLNLDK